MILDNFLFVYLYQIEVNLCKDGRELNKLKFQSEEANTDEEVKQFFKKYLLENNKIETTGYDHLILCNDDQTTSYNIADLAKCYIKNVLLPNELSVSQRQKIAASKRSIYTNPDLFVEITDGESSFFYSIELKSTKDNNIPGSSIQQVSPFEWVIFIKHNQSGIDITTGYYLNSITEKLPFPDRSPRPQIGFNTLKEWNKINRKLIKRELVFKFDTEQSRIKSEILENWQDVLCNEWLAIITGEKPKKKEKWFNNVIRKFSLKLLERIKANDSNIDELMEKIRRNMD